jgi:hypothetical protein
LLRPDLSPKVCKEVTNCSIERASPASIKESAEIACKEFKRDHFECMALKY